MTTETINVGSIVKGKLFSGYEAIVLPRTATMNARVKINQLSTGKTVKTIPYVADGSGGLGQAQKYLESFGIKIFGYLYTFKGTILLTQ